MLQHQLILQIKFHSELILQKMKINNLMTKLFIMGNKNDQLYDKTEKVFYSVPFILGASILRFMDKLLTQTENLCSTISIIIILNK